MGFWEVQMIEDVEIPFHMLNLPTRPLPTVINLNLLNRIRLRKASNEHGYYIVTTTLNTISVLHHDESTGAILFKISFNCLTVKPFVGEILIGTVTQIMENGVFLNSGPMNNIFLSKTRMQGYEFDISEEPMFLNVNGLSYIKKGTKLRFRVVDVTWIERDKEFNIVATTLGDYLGLI